jgi:hypothetical protein
VCLIYTLAIYNSHGRTGRKKIGGAERNLPDFFGLCPRCQKKFSGETFQNSCRRGGRSDYENLFLLDSIFPTKLTEFPTKLTEFVPFIFIISQYCPTACEANIGRLHGFVCPTNWGGGGGGGGGGCRRKIGFMVKFEM